MTFLPYNEQDEEQEQESVVSAFRKTEFYSALIKHTQSGNRRLVQSMLSGNNLMEAEDAPDIESQEKANDRIEQAMQAVGSGLALDILTKLISAGFDRSLLDIQPEDKKGSLITVFLSDKANKFKESLKDILAGCCDIQEVRHDQGMLMLRCAAKEGYEPGSHALQVVKELPS